MDKKTRGRKSIAPNVRVRILLRDKLTCQECGAQPKTLGGLHIHHKVRCADGGTNDDENLITLCKACHRKRHGKNSGYAKPRPSGDKQSGRISGEVVKRWRESKGLLQARLAEQLPVNLRTLQGWENGYGQPAAFVVRALADLERELGMDEIRRVIESHSEADVEVKKATETPEPEIRRESRFKGPLLRPSQQGKQ